MVKVSSRGPEARRRARELGFVAEEAVWQYLRQQGYQLVAKNLHLGHLELDLVARKRELIVVVEVKTRGIGSRTSAFGSIDRRKRSRLRLAGQRLWRQRYRNDPSVKRLRFDAAKVSFKGSEPSVEYVKAAF